MSLISGRPSAAEIYLPKFCTALVDGIQMWARQRQERVDGPLMGFERSDLVEPEEDAKIEECGIYMDDIKGLELQPELAREARREELQVFRERGAYEVVPRSSMARGSKLIGILWVKTDNGVPGKPKVHSRLVCQEFARGHTPDDMFAPTPPLVATRWLLSELAPRKGGRGRDFKRASFYADCERELYVEFELPEEDEEKAR